MYEYYYSSADVQVYFFSKDNTRFIRYDKAIGIGYNIMQTSVPVYGLNSSKAAYFSHGNTVCQGMLLTSFIDEEYLKVILKYLFKEEAEIESVRKPDALQNSMKFNAVRLTNDVFEVIADSTKGWNVAPDNDKIICIGNIYSEFDIKIFINNESAYRSSDTKIITLDSVKIVSENFDVSSGSDSHLTQGYKFIFKDIKRG
jgi:vesicle coat complex subunit